MESTLEHDPLVSVIMPCFNGEATISEAIASVISQTYSNFELIIVDDGSSDGSSAIAAAFAAREPRIVVITRAAGDVRGVSVARNVGLDRARGRFICFLDCDDYLMQKSLRLRVDALSASGAPITFGSYHRMEGENRFVHVVAKGRVTLRDMLRKNQIGNLTGMYDARKLGKQYQRNIGHEDYLMWSELIRKGGWAMSVGGECLGVYRVSSGSLSGNKFQAAVWHWRVLRQGLGLGWMSATWYQCIYVLISIWERAPVFGRR